MKGEQRNDYSSSIATTTPETRSNSGETMVELTNEQLAREYGYIVNIWGRMWYVIGPRDIARSRTQGKYARRWFATEAEAWDAAVTRIQTARDSQRKKRG